MAGIENLDDDLTCMSIETRLEFVENNGRIKSNQDLMVNDYKFSLQCLNMDKSGYYKCKGVHLTSKKKCSASASLENNKIVQIEEIIEEKSVFRTGNLIRSNLVHNHPKMSCVEQDVHKFKTDLKKNVLKISMCLFNNYSLTIRLKWQRITQLTS